MPMHRLTSVTIGVPNVAETAAYYTEFGLTPQHDGWFGTRDGGRQLRIVHSPMRRLVEVHVGADDTDDSPGSLAGCIASGLSPPADHTPLRRSSRRPVFGPPSR